MALLGIIFGVIALLVFLAYIFWPRCPKCHTLMEITIKEIGTLTPVRYAWAACPLCIEAKKLWPR